MQYWFVNGFCQLQNNKLVFGHDFSGYNIIIECLQYVTRSSTRWMSVMLSQIEVFIDICVSIRVCDYMCLCVCSCVYLICLTESSTSRIWWTDRSVWCLVQVQREFRMQHTRLSNRVASERWQNKHKAKSHVLSQPTLHSMWDSLDKNWVMVLMSVV